MHDVVIHPECMHSIICLTVIYVSYAYLLYVKRKYFN